MSSFRLWTAFFGWSVLCSLTSAFAEEPRQYSAYIVSPSIALRTGPAGNLAGTLLRNVAVQPIEQKGRWTRVLVEGWIPTNELAETPSSKASQQSDLWVSGFRLESVSKDRKDDSSKIRLLLQIKNTSKRVVNSWTAILVVQEAGGKAVVRFPIEGGALQPDEAKDFNYYWTESEEFYQPLSRYVTDNDGLTLGLLGVKLQ